VWDVNHRIHSMYPEFSYTRFSFESLDAQTEAFMKASYLITGTEEGKRQLVDMYGVYPRKIRIVPFPTPVLPDAPQGALPRGVTERRPYIFYPARFWPQKNHVVLVAALKVLRDSFGIRQNVVFCGIDEGNLDYVMRYADGLGVRDQVHYIGRVSDEEMTQLYRNAFALAFVSATGPDNLPPLEAMALGCPVIAADVPGARERYGDAAVYFPTTDERILAERIKTLVEDRTVRDELIGRGFDMAKRWTVDDYAKAVVAIFDEFALIARAWERCDSVFT
jgi:glycosyltransferase involved in cell wall biosynthesis